HRAVERLFQAADHAQYAVELYRAADAQPVPRIVCYGVDTGDGRVGYRGPPPADCLYSCATAYYPGNRHDWLQGLNQLHIQFPPSQHRRYYHGSESASP